MRPQAPRRTGVLLCLPLLIGAVAFAAGPASAAPTPDEPAKGLEYQGLERATAGPCQGKFEIKANGAPSGPPRCTHGPDAAPAGVDVRVQRAPETPGETADRKSTRLNSSHIQKSRMPSSA